jgi:hypothetical protein
MITFLRFLPPAAVFVFGVALQISGYENPQAAKALFALAPLLLVFAAWPWLRRIKLQSPVLVTSTVRGPQPPLLEVRPSPATIEFSNHRPGWLEYRRWLREASTNWVAWGTASEANTAFPDFTELRISRMILIDPRSPYIQLLADAFDVSEEQLKENVREATRRAVRAKTAVHWSRGPFPLMTIGNPHAARGGGNETTCDWAVVEIALPHLGSSRRPNFRVRKPDCEEAVQALFDMYTAVWAKGYPPDW